MATAVELVPFENDEFESDDTPSVGPQRTQSSGWKPAPSPCASRGPHPLVDEPAQDFTFSAIPAGSMTEAQRQATEMHR